MKPHIVLGILDCFDGGTVVKPQKFKKLQKECTHDVVITKEDQYELKKYECLLCRKTFEGYHGEKLPKTSKVLSLNNSPAFFTNLPSIYQSIIIEFAQRHRNDNIDIDIYSIIEDLKPVLFDLDKAIDNSDNIRNIKNNTII